MISDNLSNNVFSHGRSNDNNNANFEENKYLDLSSKDTVTKNIAFEELCPVWSKKLSLGLDRVDKFMIDRDSKYCIVGEAWKFSGRYTGYYLAPLIPFVGCWTCIKYSRKFAKISKNKNIKEGLTRTDFEPLIEYFINHWNEKHTNKNIKK
ncbi:MAG TPA: hypothetical protein VJ767_04615 [Nitrososphaeraceae archaeon]|nr:hypothetical protein [Nitrososphaeraceae archaeon]